MKNHQKASNTSIYSVKIYTIYEIHIYSQSCDEGVIKQVFIISHFIISGADD